MWVRRHLVASLSKTRCRRHREHSETEVYGFTGGPGKITGRVRTYLCIPPHTGANHVHYAHIPLADSVLKFGVAHAGSSPWTEFFFVQWKEYLRNKAKRQKWIDRNFIWPTNNSLLITCLWLETLTLCAHMLSVLIGYFRKLHKTVQQTNGDSESSHVHQLGSTDVIQRDTWFPLKMVQASPLINVPFISIVSLIPRGPLITCRQ